LTQNQLHELLDSDQAKALVEGAEERGYLEPAELEAFSLEHDLNEDEVEELTRELERIGLEVRQPAAEAEKEAEKEKAAEPAETHVLSGSADSLQLFLADVEPDPLELAGQFLDLASLRSCSRANASSSAASRCPRSSAPSTSALAWSESSSSCS